MIEEAQTTDFPELKTIGMACFENSIRTPGENYLASVLFRRYFSKRRFRARQHQGTRIFVYRHQDALVGFYELETDGLLSSLYVDPDHQKKGYGGALLRHAEQLAGQLKLPKLRLDSSQKAVIFYEAHGYQKVKKARYVFGVCMIPMEKQLSKA